MRSWRGSFLHWLHPPGAVRPRYTLAKFTAYIDYARQSSRWRHAAVILVTPLPSLAIALLAPLVPLQDPRLGVRANTGFFINFFVLFMVITPSATCQIRATAQISASDYPLTDMLSISIVTSIVCTLLMFATASLWRFPVPFSIVLLFGPLFVCFVVAHIAVLRGRLWNRDSVLRRPILAFFPSFAVMTSQIVAYSALSAVFATASEFSQLALIVVSALTKFGFRKLLRRLARHLLEDGNESAVSGVEIAAVMYQSMLMQNTPSPYATTLLIGMDIAALFIGILVFMTRPSSVPSAAILTQAAELLCTDPPNAPHPKASELSSVGPVTRVGDGSSRRVVPVHPQVSQRNQELTPTVVHALELLHNAESHVLIEFFEASQPAVNALYISLATLMPSAEYNPKLHVYRHDVHALHDALTNLAIYTALQAASFVIMHVVVAWRYRLSTTTLLAFLLERHVWAIQGKLIMWIMLMSQVSVLHYGFDFTFQFRSSLPPLE